MRKRSGTVGFKTSAAVVCGFVALIWAVEIVDALFFGQSLDRFGVQPRRLAGLSGILFAPFLHGGFGHAAANTIPFFVLGGMVMLRRLNRFVAATFLSMLIGGLGVWLLGASNTVHIGASTLVFGYFGFLIALTWFERSFGAIAIAAFVIVLYGGMIYGLRPFQGHVSWLGHLFGLIGGVEAARLTARRR